MRTTHDGNGVDLKRFVDDLRAVLEDGQELLRSGISGIKEKAAIAGETTGRLTRERPYQAIGAAFGLGLVLGLIAAGIFSGREEKSQ